MIARKKKPRDSTPQPKSELVLDRSHRNHWFNRASDLRAAAGAIWFASRAPSTSINEVLQLTPGFNVGLASTPVYRMLCGMALEVMFKALIVKRGEDPPRTHDLNQLAKVVDFQVDEPERKLLDFYTANIYWAGRYPVPLNPTDQDLHAFWDNAHDVLTKPVEPPMTIQLTVGSGATHWEPFHKLWERAAEQFHWNE